MFTKYVYNDEGRQFVAAHVSESGIRCWDCANNCPEQIIGVVVDYSKRERCEICGQVLAEVQG